MLGGVKMRSKTKHLQDAILKALSEDEAPAGAVKLIRRLRVMGLDMQPRTVRAYLLELDNKGFTELESRRKGRKLTERGRRELTNTNVYSKLGFLAAKVDEYGCQMTYSLRSGKGTVVANMALIRERDLSRALLFMAPAFHAGVGVSNRIAVVRAGSSISDFSVPLGSIAMVTISSVTINGILLSKGIPVTSRFGGLLEMRDGTPLRFIDVIEYNGTTINPIELFSSAGMTEISKYAKTGRGVVGAVFCEIPACSVKAAKNVFARMHEWGLSGDIVMGEASLPLLDIPVTEGRTGLILMGGINPLAVLHEVGIPVTTRSLSGVVDIARFSSFEDAERLGRPGPRYVD